MKPFLKLRHANPTEGIEGSRVTEGRNLNLRRI